MMRVSSKVIIGIVCFVLGAGGGLLYGNIRLKKETSLRRELVNEANKKKDDAYKKYQEKNLLSVQLSRAKSTLEGNVFEAQSKEKKEAQEKEDALNRNKILEDNIEDKTKKILSLEAEVKTLSERLDAANREKKESDGKYSAEVTDLSSRVNNLGLEKKGLESGLKTAQGTLEKYRVENDELCKLAEEILARYENKTGIKSLMEKEPFIQSKKIELEKYEQEYKDKIEKHRQTQ